MLSSDTQYTVLTSPAQGYTVGAQLDFRVEAIIGHIYDPMPDRLIFITDFMTDASSGWSNIQTITIPNETTPVPTQTINQLTNPPTAPDNNQSQMPEQPQQPTQPQMPEFVFNSLFSWVIGVLFVGMIIVVVMTFTKWHMKSEYNNDFS